MFLGLFVNYDYHINESRIERKSQESFFYQNGFLTFSNDNTIGLPIPLVGLIRDDGTLEVVNHHNFEIASFYLSIDDFLNSVKKLKYGYKIPIVVLDKTIKQVVLVRDLFGTIPLYYIHIPGKLYAFSSSLSSLVSLKEIEDFLEPDVAKISAYLTWMKDGNPGNSSSFFLHIKKLLPGNLITIGTENLTTSAFHQFDLINSSEMSGIGQYGSKFQSIFQESVSDSLPTDRKIKVAAQLSGGLDSSSICGMIRKCENDLEFDTIYVDTDTALTSESGYAMDVARSIHSNHHSVRLDSHHLQSAELHIELFGHPDYMQNSAVVNKSVMETAKSLGCSVLFSGHPGDAIVGYGLNYLKTLFSQRNWPELYSILSKDLNLSQSYKNSGSENPLYRIIYSFISQEKSILNRLELIALIFKASKFFNIPLRYFINHAFRKIKDTYALPSSILNADIEEIKQTASPYQYCVIDDYVLSNSLIDDKEHFNSPFSEQMININEEFYILDQYYAVSHSFPFLDKELFELSMVVPSKDKYASGSRRGHLREAMKGIIPEGVRTRRSKANFGLYGRQSALTMLAQSEHLLSHDSDVWNYVDMSKFEQAKSLLGNERKPLYIHNKMQFYVSRTIYLAIWLDKLKNRSFHSFL